MLRRTVSNLSTNVPYIRAASPSYPSYYKSNLTKSDNEKISFLTECLKEKEEELAILNKCLEEKENELKIYKGKNKKIRYKIEYLLYKIYHIIIKYYFNDFI